MGAGLGELDAELAIAFSGRIGAPRSDAGMPAVREERLRACARALIPDVRDSDRGDWGGSMSPILGTGDADKEPALNG
jgi:hypothetical protein